MAAHARLAPSAAHRWLNCPRSVRLTEGYPDTRSEFAAEGSAAHALAEIILGQNLEAAGYHVLWSHDPIERAMKSRFYGPDMRDYVEAYAAQVIERVNALKTPTVLLEKRVNFAPYVPESYGTSDVIIISEGVLEVVDLKYGKGVPVDARENPQLMLYGLGAYLAFEPIYDLERTRVTIMQPRLDSVSTYELSVDDLLTWAREEVSPRAEEALRGEGVFKAGDWCRFCPAKADCRTRADENLKLLKQNFALPPLLSPEEIAGLLPKIDRLKTWAADIEEYALKKALEGVEFPGYKLVAGRTRSHYADEAAVIKALEDDQISSQDYMKPPELRGLTEMKKLLGSKRYAELVAPHLEKSPGKPTLVPESDKRPPLQPASAKEDFEAVPED